MKALHQARADRDDDVTGVFARPKTLRAASRPRPLEAQRLLHVERSTGQVRDGAMGAIADFARPGDVWVVNDAATLPASLSGHDERGRAIELRLAGALPERSRWTAIVFGAGDWRDDTDRREPPPALHLGARLTLGPLRARVVAIDPQSPRLVEVAFAQRGAAFWQALYAHGRPVQYRYVERALSLSDVQTPLASRPWAVEAPSAGRSLHPRVLGALRARGATIATLTHAAGLSASGDAALDARLPLPERYSIPRATVEALGRARRVVAVGTSVTRALEGAALQGSTLGTVSPGPGTTDLRIGEATPLRVVHALLTGAHDPSSSHYDLLRAFAPEGLLRRAVQTSAALGYLGHELGDSWLIA